MRRLLRGPTSTRRKLINSLRIIIVERKIVKRRVMKMKLLMKSVFGVVPSD